MNNTYYYKKPCVATKICNCPPACPPPVSYSCPAPTMAGPVNAANGAIQHMLDLISVPALGGSGGVSMCAIHVPCPDDDPNADRAVGRLFDLGQNLRIAPSSSGSGVDLRSPQGTTEGFGPDGAGGLHPALPGNNTSAELKRDGKGTAAETFTLTSRDGTVTKFHGIDPAVATPGKIRSLTDKHGNTQSFAWTKLGGSHARLTSITDSYGRTFSCAYHGPENSYYLKEVTDFAGRSVKLQYDADGRLVAVVLPAVTKGAAGNTFPGGTAYVYQYDTANLRPERRDDLVKVFYPNQVVPHLDTAARTVDVAAVYASSAKARLQFEYGNDPTDVDHYGRVTFATTGDPAAGVGGAYGYIYLSTGLPANSIDPADPIVARTVVTDRNGNQAVYDFNASQMPVRVEQVATRAKNSLQAASWVTWTKYNAHNQPVLVVMPEGNSIEHEYEDETNTIQFAGVPYGRRIGMLKRTTRKPGNTIGIPSRAGSGPAGAVQTQLTQRYFYDPIFGHACASIEERGNPIDASSGLYFPPQNLGTTPTDADRSRYATITYYDYQKDSTATVQGDAALQAQLGLTGTQIGQLITFVSNQMSATGGTGGLPAGFEMGIGDVNGEGTGAGTSNNARHQGSVVKVKHPAVRQLVPNTGGGGTPWVWQTQDRIELYTSNARGQQTTATDPEGNLSVYVRYPENDPEGGSQYVVPTLSNQQYGFIKEVHVDADPATVMSLIGSDGDMSTFIGNKIARTNTPGVYQDLVTRYQGGGSGSGGCSSCGAYDSLGNPTSTTDARGFTTTVERNELGEVYRTTTDAPYSQRTETYYDANRNVIRTDVEDRQVQYDSTDPSDPNYAKFTPTGSGSVANLPTTAGPGGAVRPGWFTNLYSFDLLDQKVEEDLDATGSTPSSLVSTYAYDANQNLVTLTNPMGNLVEYDYDERDLRIATRVGYDPANGNLGAVTVMAYDGNGNLIDVVGPMQRGTASQRLSVVIDDAFRSGVALTHVGDWVAQNTYDGFDRMTQSTDAVGGTGQSTFDPGGRAIASVANGTAGGTSPTDRLGMNNVLLASGSTRFDEAGRTYESQQDVFLNTGKSGGSPMHTLPSGRAVTHTGGGLAANDTANSHTGTVTLTTGGSSYVLGRMVYDRASRTAASATDNTAITTVVYDGANRQQSVTDALGNVTQNTYDANGNVVGTTRVEKCTLGGAIPTESFASAMSYDLLNRVVLMASQGPGGVLNATLDNCCAPPATPNLTLFTLYGYDSRGNRTNLMDPQGNTSVWVYDGASRQLQSRQHLRIGGSGTASIDDTVITTSQYDANSCLIRLVDDNGGTSTWAYDTLDRQTVMTFHDGSTRTSTYNLASNVTGYVDENGSSFSYSYDAVGRRTACTITLASGVVGTTAQSFQYDGLGRTTFSRDSVGATNTDAAVAFDSVGRVPEEAQTYGADPRYVTQDKWTSLPPTELTFPSGRQVSGAYDALYRRNVVTETSGGASIAAWEFFGYRTALITLGNGLVASFMNNAQNRSAVQSGQTTPAWGDKTTDRVGYDGSGRLIAKRYLPAASTTSLIGFTTAYDPSSNKLFERALNAESRSNLYPSYDSMDRLLEYQRGTLASGGGTISTPTTLPAVDSDRTYNLDGLGNWQNTAYVPVGGSAATETRQHNKLNEVTQFGVSPASTPVLYDHGNNTGASAVRGNGNITDDGTRLYTYDALNRLTTVKRKSDGATVAQYVYDALGRRVRKAVSNGGVTGTVANTTSRYISSGSQIVEELDGSNATVRQFIWGQYIDELIQMKTLVSTGSQPLAAGVYYPLQDLLYRTTALTSGAAAIVEAYDTDAYGNTLIYKGAGADGLWFTDDDVRTDQPACETIFTGRQYDPETQVYYYRARYYQRALGRFNGKDPILQDRLVATFYEYTGSDPLISVDPLGEATVGNLQDASGGIMGWFGWGTVHHTYTAARLNLVDCCCAQRLVDAIWGDLQRFKRFNPNPEGTVRVNAAGTRASFGIPGFAAGVLGRISNNNPFRVSLASHPESHTLRAVTEGLHPLAGVREWRVKSSGQNGDCFIVVETEAYEAPRSSFAGGNIIGRATAGASAQANMWDSYMTSIATAYVMGDWCVSLTWMLIPTTVTDLGTLNNPWLGRAMRDFLRP